ncbi:hypothetical protein FSP39_003233 [Pinctada imbricata]|uniref:Uncharacterized protein n=1 Tax=Pinctada imbricata TaxID=66713 RepID=A0AA88XTA2_PINIB|nr:hypothetical protein FSP39_003233 [Pinctada imbricata]
MAAGSVPLMSPLGPKEETLLEEFFVLVSQFAFDKAKEIMDKRKESQKSVFGSSWALLIHSLSQLAVAEKTYTSLGFLEQKGFFTRSKDTLKNCYNSLIQEFRKVEETVRGLDSQNYGMPRPTLEFEQLLAHLCGQLSSYEQIHIMGQTKHVSFGDLSTVITEIIQSHSKGFHHPLLVPLKAAFGYECDIINHLLQAQLLMYEWQFLQSLLHLHQAHTKLASWGASVQIKEGKKSTFGGKSSGLPALYEWLVHLKLHLLSKFTIYFYDTLQSQATPSEMKTLCNKTYEDFVTRIHTFQKKSDAYHVSLVLDSQDVEGQGSPTAGYTLPDRVIEAPTGLDSFPVIFSCPGEKPASHWPNVVMLISDRKDVLSATHDKIQYLYDKASIRVCTRPETLA